MEKVFNEIVEKKDFININNFQIEFKRAHEPLKKVFIVLCKDCHREYDKKPIKK